MSKIAKGIGKVFKKVGKFVMKVAPYALAAAAVVFTGGAALGLGFAAGGFSAAVGSVVTSLGIGGAVGGALTGAITGAGMGAAVGGILGGKKGLKKGFISGALTGGVLGAVSPASVGIVKGANGVWTTKQALSSAASAAAKGGASLGASSTVSTSVTGATAPGIPTTLAPMNLPNVMGPGSSVVGAGLNAGGAVASSAASVAPSIPGVAAPQPMSFMSATQPVTSPPAPVSSSLSIPMQGVQQTGQQSGGGLMGGFFEKNPNLAGNLLKGVGGVLKGSGKEDDRARQEAEAQARVGINAYGGAYTRPDPFGLAGGMPQIMPQPGRWFFNPQTNTVEEVPI